MSSRVNAKSRSCRCESPALAVDLSASSVVCSSCSRTARSDLGGADDLARARYRVRYDRATRRLREVTRPLTASKRIAQNAALRRIEARRLRDEERLSQRAIAERLGVSQRTIGLDLSDALRERGRQRSAEWRANNPERAKASQTQYRKENALDVRIAQRESRALRKDQIRERRRAWRAANRDRVNAYARDYYARTKAATTLEAGQTL